MSAVQTCFVVSYFDSHLCTACSARPVDRVKRKNVRQGDENELAYMQVWSYFLSPPQGGFTHWR